MAEPIGPKVVNALYMNPGRSKEYGWSKFQILPENNFDNDYFWNYTNLDIKIRENFLFLVER